MDSAIDIAVSTAAAPRVLDLARALVDELHALDRPASLVLDRMPALATGRVSCLVHPHAGFGDSAGRDLDSVRGLLRRSLVLHTGALDATTAWVLRPARATIALREDALHELRVSGLDPVLLLPGAPRADGPAGERDLDVVVCEGYSPERWRILARCARMLDGWRCDLRSSYVGIGSGPVEHLPDGPDRRALYRRARFAPIVGDGPSLDVLAALEATAHGAVVVTDAMLDLAPFTPGVDIVCADADALPTVLDALLHDRAREGALRAAGAALVLRESLARMAEQLARLVDGPARRPLRAAPPRQPEAPAPQAASPVPEPYGIAGVLSEQRRLNRRLALLEGRTVERTVTTTTGWDGASAELSVVVPLFDYEQFIGAACASALAARGVELELIVVDDASRDGGAAEVERVIAANPEAAIALCRLSENGGLANARNVGASIARSQLLLFLDADDELLPHGPANLRRALDEDADAAFAYGLMSVETSAGPDRLLNVEPWDPDLLRRGNYVNALALVRAGAYEQVGGYRSDGPLEIGWEDYDLWLRMARARLRGAHVREFTARYRAHDGSRTAIADLAAGELMEYLRGQYPDLLARAPA